MRLFNANTKTKVVIGFGLALSVVAVAIYLTYSSFTQLLNSVVTLSEPNSKLAKLQHTLSDIAAAESSIRTYTLTTEDKHFDAYLTNLERVDCQIHSLRILMAYNKSELAQIDSISVLLQTKKQSLEKYVALKKQRRSHNYSDKAMRQIASKATTQPVATTIKQNTVTTISDRLLIQDADATPEKPAEEEGKRGLFNRIFSRKQEPRPEERKQDQQPAVLVPKITVKKETSIDSSTASEAVVTDVAHVRRILSKIQREVNQYEGMLIRKELALLQQDKHIMDQIRNMIHKLEQHETQLAAQSSARAKEVAKNTSLILLLVGIFGLLSGVAFILVILRDLTRSNRYKAQLIKARKEAVQLARSKEAFVANMSHEIRTPLNVMLGFSEQLQHTPLLPDQQEHLQAIRSAGDHLLHIVNDVLDLSKIEAGKLQIKSAAFELPQLLKEVYQAFSLKAEAKGIKLGCHTDAQLPVPLLGDPLRLKQVLFNLVDNAIKFTHDGEVQVTCRLKAERRNRVVVSIEVSDTGIGIPLEQAEHVFGEFNQADDSIIRKYGGTGLGLSISKKLTEMQGGSLTLRSTPGKGTTFIIVLPLYKTRTANSAAPEETQCQSVSLKGNHVLVIDDDAYSRSLCEIILRRWGMHVYLANDGQEALQAIESQPFDLVLTDIQLPGMSGKTVARSIRKKDAAVPIIALTANTLCNNNFFSQTGISDFLLKPFTEQELHQKVAQALNSSHAGRLQPHSKNTATERSNTSLYDLSEMRLFAGDDKLALTSILEVLVADHRQNLTLLAQAATEQDWQAVGSLAHKMLTAFKHLKAYTITPALEELELLLHQQQASTGMAEPQQLITQLLKDVPPLLEELELEVSSLQAGQETVV